MEDELTLQQDAPPPSPLEVMLELVRDAAHKAAEDQAQGQAAIQDEIDNAIDAIDAAINQIIAQAGLDESNPEIADAIAYLKSFAASLSGSGVTSASLATIIASVKSAITYASDLANGATNESSAEASQTYNQARINHARYLMAQSEFYTQYGEMMSSSALADIYSVLSPDMHQQMAIDYYATMSSDKDALIAHLTLKSLTLVETQEVQRTIDERMEKISEILNDPNLSPEKRSRLEARMNALLQHPTPEQIDDLYDYAKGQVSDVTFDSETDAITAQKIDLLKHNPMFDNIDFSRIAEEMGYSSLQNAVKAGIFSPENLKKLSPDNPDHAAILRAAGLLTATQVAQQQYKFALELGLGVDYKDMNVEDLQKLLLENDTGLKDFQAFNSLSSEEQVKQMAKQNNWSPEEQQSALAIARITKLSQNEYLKQNPNADPTLVAIQMNGAMSDVMSASERRPNETDDHAYNLRMKNLARSLEKDKTLNPLGLSLSENPELLTQLMTAAANAKSDEEFFAQTNLILKEAALKNPKSEEEIISAAQNSTGKYFTNTQKMLEINDPTYDPNTSVTQEASYYKSNLVYYGLSEERAAELATEKYGAEILAASASLIDDTAKNVYESITSKWTSITQGISKNAETGNYESSNMSIAPDVAEAALRAAGVAVFNSETGNYETSNMSVAPIAPLQSTPTSSIVSVIGGLVSTAPAAITPLPPEAANNNIIGCIGSQLAACGVTTPQASTPASTTPEEQAPAALAPVVAAAPSAKQVSSGPQ